MHRTRVPEDQISRLCANLDKLTSSVGEPFDLILVKAKPVGATPSCSLNNLRVGLEELVIDLLRSLHAEQTAVIRTIGRKVYNALNALHSFPLRRLIDVRPRLCLLKRCASG